jgi:hypothetical protein
MISSIENLGDAGLPASTTKNEPSGSLVQTASLSLTTSGSGLVAVPHGTGGGSLLPVACVKTYLAQRTVAVCRYQLEIPLFNRLPLLLRNEVRRLQAAVEYVQSLTTGRTAIKVQPACEMALRIYTEFRPLGTFRGKFDLWLRSQDWLTLVNRAKAGPAWQTTQRGLSDTFLDYVAKRAGEFKRGDTMEQAILSIHRQWITGRTQHGIAEPVAGYEVLPDGRRWEDRQRAVLPDGWHSTNIRQQIKKRAKFTKAVKAMLHQGCAAARAYTPNVHSTRDDGTPLRFMELVQFDDVRCDFRVMDTESGQVNDLWLLIARDVATGMLLGFGMRPARARDDGSQEHLKLQDMKQLCGWLLETFGLPPYQMTWVLENGTATLGEAVRAALREMVGEDRIKFEMAQMIGGKSSMGYWEKAVGNSKAKAMLECLNRLMHMMASYFPGQIGLNYSKVPAELRDREREAVEIWSGARPSDRAELRYPFYTIPQARTGLFEIFTLQNRRWTHKMEGFKEIAEWYDAAADQWKPAQSAPADMTGVRTRRRKETPLERAAWLLAPYKNNFQPVSPEILTAFYEHTQRTVVVSDKGQVQIMVDGKTFRFSPPAPAFALPPETKCLGYFNPDDPRFLTLTDGRGGVLGTWARVGLVKHGDTEALAAAIRHSTTALNAVKTRAHDLASGDREQLEAMREHNRQVAGTNQDFITVGASALAAEQKPLSSPVARTVRAVMTEKQKTKKQQQRRDEDERIAREALEL